MDLQSEPVLSVVVAIVSDTTDHADSSHLIPCLAALKKQKGAPSLEIIVPYHPSLKGIAQCASSIRTCILRKFPI